MTNVPYGGDDSSYALYNGQLVIGQAYTVWSNAAGTSQVTTNLLNSSNVAVGTPYYVYSNSLGQLQFATAANIQPVWVKAVGDPNGQLVQMSPTSIPSRVVTLESEILNVVSLVAPITITGNLSPNYTQTNLLANAVAGNITITLPTASGHAGIVFMVKKIDSTGNTVTVQSTGGQNIDGSSSPKILAQTERCYQFISDGSSWWVIVDFHPGAPSAATLQGGASAAVVGASGYAADAAHQHPFIGAAAGGNVQFVTGATYTVLLTDNLLLANASSGAQSIFLPTATGCAGQSYVIKKTDTTGNIVTLVPFSGGQAIDGQTSLVLSRQLQYVEIQSDGFEWWIISSNLASFNVPAGTAAITHTTTYAINSNDAFVLCDGTSGAFTVTLPTATGLTGETFFIEKIDGSAHAITVATTSAQTINGNSTLTLSAQYAYYQVVSNGTNWYITDSTVFSGVTLDTTATDITTNGTQAAGSIGKAADSGHVHPFNSVSAFNLSAISNTETLILKLPLVAVNVKAGSTYIARIVGLWTNGAANGTAMAWTIRAGTAGTTADTTVANSTHTNSTTVSAAALLQIDITFTLTGTGATAAIVGNITSLEAGLVGGYAGVGDTTQAFSTTTGWNTSTATFLDLTFNAGLSTNSLTVQSAYLAQVA